MKGKAAQRQLLQDKAAALGRCIQRVQEEVAYIKSVPPQQQGAPLDITCQRLALYAVLDDYVYVTRDCDFPPLPTLKGMEKSVLRERNVRSGAGPPLVQAPVAAASRGSTKRRRGNESEEKEEGESEEETKQPHTSRGKPIAARAAKKPATAAKGKKAAPAPAPRRSSRR